MCYTKYVTCTCPVMDDFENFASYLGFTGVDSDMFYEAYYELTTDDEEYETAMEESYEGAY